MVKKRCVIVRFGHAEARLDMLKYQSIPIYVLIFFNYFSFHRLNAW